MQPRIKLSDIKRQKKRKDLEALFKEHGIEDKEKRIALMIKAMGNPAVHYCGGFPSVKERYEVIIGSFLAGVWERNYSSFKRLPRLPKL